MSRKQQYTDEELKRILEEWLCREFSTKFIERGDSATEEEHSNVPDFDDDDSVADPDFFLWQLIRHYNPNKTHKYGLQIYKATADDGYVWKYKVYTGQDPQISNLDKPGSVVVELFEDLLHSGRIIIADNWYTSLPLAEYWIQRKTSVGLWGKIEKTCHDWWKIKK